MSQPDTTPTHRWATAFTWTVLSQLVLGATRLILSVVIGRYLGKELLGQTSALLSVATILVMLWPQATGVAVAKFIAVASTSAGRASVAAYATMSSFRVSAALGVIGALWAWAAFDAPLVTCVSAGVLVVVMALSATVRGVRNGRGLLARATYADLVGSALGLVLLAVVVAEGLDSLLLLPIVLSFLPGVVTGWPRTRPALEPGYRQQFVGFTAWTSAHIVAASALLPLLTIVTALATSPAALGDFAAAASLATPLLLLSLASRSALEPFVAAHSEHRGRESSQHLVDALFRAMVVGFVALFGVTVLWADQLLERLYSSAYSSGTPVLILLLAGVGVSSLNASHVWLSSSETWGPRALAWANVSGSVVGLTVAVLAVSRLEAVGAALGLLAGAVVSTSVTTAIVWRVCGMSWAPLLLRAMAGCALVAGGFAGPLHSDLAARAAFTAGFVLLWWLMTRRDASRAKLLIAVGRTVS